MPAIRVTCSYIAPISLICALAVGCGGDEKPKIAANPFGGAGGGAGSGATGGNGASGGGASGGSSSGGASGGAASGGSSATGATGGSASGGSAGIGATGGSGATGGAGATGGTSGTGGSGGTGPTTCGNGMLDFDEPCDFDKFGLRTCQTEGFDMGEILCLNCQLDLSGCSGAERCDDGIDNDNDSLFDCDDTDDCAAACADSCAAPELLADPATVPGDNTGHASQLRPSCLRMSNATDAENVYRFVAANTGVLEARLLSTNVNHSLSLRSSCADVSAELACAENGAGSLGEERILIPVTQNDEVFIVVDGSGSGELGDYELSVMTREILCGDGQQDPGEQCDDGFPGGECDDNCLLVDSGESEPNDSTANPDPVPADPPFSGAVNPAGDVDVYSFPMTAGNAGMEVNLFDLGNGACAQGEIDSLITVFDTNGSTVVASDADSGDGLCSSLITQPLAAGTYFVEVRAGASSPTFAYLLGVFQI